MRVVTSRHPSHDQSELDLVRGIETRLTSGPGSEAYPVWQPDGRSILFADEKYSNTTLNLARKRLDTGVEDQLLPKGPQQRRPIDVSGDGHTLLFTERTTRGTLDIYSLPLSGPATPSLRSTRTRASLNISAGRAMPSAVVVAPL